MQHLLAVQYCLAVASVLFSNKDWIRISMNKGFGLIVHEGKGLKVCFVSAPSTLRYY